MDQLITAHGAIGDGKTLNTAAIQKAIDAAHAAGGGRVVVPPGNWLSGSLFLKSHVTFEVQSGATLVGSPRLEDYVAVTPPHDGDRTRWHLLAAHGQEAVTLCGGGIVEGNGPVFWSDPPWPGTWLGHRGNQRPSPLLDVRDCRNVRVENLRFHNAPGWTLHFHHSDRVWVRGIEIDNPLFGPNTDGIDISACSDVMISDSYVSAADDAIVAFPSMQRDCCRVTVTNCCLRTNCVAFKAYLFPSHSVRDLVFTNSVVFETNRMLGLYGSGAGVIENVVAGNIVCDTNCPVTFTRPIHIDVLANSKYASTVRNVQVSNCVCRTDGRILMTAAPGATLENITFRDLRLTYPVLDDPRPYGGRKREATGDQSSGWAAEARVALAAIVAQGVKNFVADNVMIDWPTAESRAGWIARPRAGNGTHDLFPPPPQNPPDFQVLWGRGLRGGWLRMPSAQSGRAGVEALNLEDSDIRTE